VKRSRRKKRRQVKVPIASMGDIAFLLIIFFLLLSEFTKDNKNVLLTPPESAQVEKSKAVAVARVAVDQSGTIYLDGNAVESVKDIEWGVRALISGTVTDEQRHVQFKCDANLPKETFEPIIKAIVEAGGILEAVGEKPQ
jgi:biopolymer transport protein ExbD